MTLLTPRYKSAEIGGERAKWGGGGRGIIKSGGMRRETQGMSDASYFTYAPVEDLTTGLILQFPRQKWYLKLEVMFEISNFTA